MKYLLDTNIVIAVLNNNIDLIAKIRQYPAQDCAIFSIVVFELYYGACKSGKQAKNLARLTTLSFPVLPFTAEDAQRAGSIRTELERRGTPIGNFDLLIAAQTLSHRLTLITHNVREFSRIAGLQWEDWLHD